MSRPARIVALVAMLAVAVPGAFAANRAVDSDGAVHRIDVESWTQGGTTTSGSVLRHVVTSPDGTVVSEPIPETADLALDRDAVIDLDPTTEEPIVAWSRNDGGGFRVVAARRIDGVWTPAITVGGGGGLDHGRPHLRARKNLVHVVWTAQGALGSERFRSSLDRETFAIAYGPEALPLNDAQTVPSTGGTGLPTDDATYRLSYFVSDVTGGTTPGTGMIVVWGIRDEPLPITYYQPFETPPGVRAFRELGAGWNAGTFMTWFVSGSNFYYSIREPDRWTEFRSIVLEPGTGGAEGLRLVEAMLRRVREGSRPD